MRVGWRALAATGLRASGRLSIALGLLLLVYQCETWFICGKWPPVTLDTLFGTGAPANPDMAPTKAPTVSIGVTPLAPLLLALGLALRLAASQTGRLKRRTAGMAPAVR